MKTGVDHYENFPVASILLPKHLRPAVQAIYRFARTADDIADEGDAKPSHRLQALQDYRRALQQLQEHRAPCVVDGPLAHVFTPLHHAILAHQLPWQPFYDLLSAFEQDVSQSRYQTHAQLLDYCRLSANPVGVLMLHLFDAAQPQSLAWSDAICTGLQLTNFWQDVAIDWHKQRVYIPQDALHRHGLQETHLAAAVAGDTFVVTDPRWQSLMQEQVQLARQQLQAGQPLGRHLRGRIGYELRLVVEGGLRILERLDQLHYDVFRQRPTLGKADWLRLLWRAR